jgi:plastocyanin
MSRILSAAATGLLIAVVTACGGGVKSTPASETASTATATASASATTSQPAASRIVIDGFRFGDQLTVPSGAQVTVVNKDSAEHTVTSDEAGAFDSEVEGNGQTTFTAPKTPGTYPFHCNYHPSMRGVLVVQ